MKILRHFLLAATLSAGLVLPSYADNFDAISKALASEEFEKAYQLLLDEANSNNPAVLHNLGVMFATGQGTSQNDGEAFKRFLMAAAQGAVADQNTVGFRFAAGLGMAMDKQSAAKWFRKSADQGYAQAQYNLGVLYAAGVGVKKNAFESIRFLKKAAEQGYAPAQYNLGLMYAASDREPRNLRMATQWFHAALTNPGSFRFYDLGFQFVNESGQPFAFLDPNPVANAKDEPPNPLEVNQAPILYQYRESLRWLYAPDLQPLAQAQYQLGQMYLKGFDVPKNPSLAYVCWFLAASKGHESARRQMKMAETALLKPAERERAQRFAEQIWAKFGY